MVRTRSGLLSAMAVGLCLPVVVDAQARADEESLTTMGQARELFSRVNRLELRLQASVAAAFVDGDGRADVSLQIAPRADYWYQVDLGAGTERSIRSQLFPDGRFEQMITRRERILISARVFKRLGPLVLSGGLIDGRGGLGAGLRAFDDRLRLDVVGYQFRAEGVARPRLRASTSFQWRWMFVEVGVQDMLDLRLRTPFLGGGLRWRDNDLKAVAFWASRLPKTARPRDHEAQGRGE